MYLYQFDLVRRMLQTDMSDAAIMSSSGVPQRFIQLIREGAKPASYILLHNDSEYCICPECHHKTLLPCLTCFMKKNPGVQCIEVVARPAKNHVRPLQITLDILLQQEEEEDNYDDGFEVGD